MFFVSFFFCIFDYVNIYLYFDINVKNNMWLGWFVILLEGMNYDNMYFFIRVVFLSGVRQSGEINFNWSGVWCIVGVGF